MDEKIKCPNCKNEFEIIIASNLALKENTFSRDDTLIFVDNKKYYKTTCPKCHSIIIESE